MCLERELVIERPFAHRAVHNGEFGVGVIRSVVFQIGFGAERVVTQAAVVRHCSGGMRWDEVTEEKWHG